MTANPLLEVDGLTKFFYSNAGLFSRKSAVVKAVNGVSFDILPGEVVGLVGESGSGKSTVGRSILRLIKPTSGAIKLRDVDLAPLSESEMRRYRKHMQMVFQDPYASLNPRMTVEAILTQVLQLHGLAGDDVGGHVVALLEQVGLSSAHLGRYPHEFSGGQRQRIGIARAVSLRPELIIADEPVSALDVSVQAQVINLLQDLQKEMGLALLFIAHDLSVVEYISDRVIVMYLGCIVEIASSRDLYANPCHPYTEALLSSIPVPYPNVKRRPILLEGDVPSPLDPPSGCVFRTRCPIARSDCARERPPLVEIRPKHFKACFYR